MCGCGIVVDSRALGLITLLVSAFSASTIDQMPEEYEEDQVVANLRQPHRAQPAGGQESTRANAPQACTADQMTSCERPMAVQHRMEDCDQEPAGARLGGSMEKGAGGAGEEAERHQPDTQPAGQLRQPRMPNEWPSGPYRCECEDERNELRAVHEDVATRIEAQGEPQLGMAHWHDECHVPAQDGRQHGLVGTEEQKRYPREERATHA